MVNGLEILPVVSRGSLQSLCLTAAQRANGETEVPNNRHVATTWIRLSTRNCSEWSKARQYSHLIPADQQRGWRQFAKSLYVFIFKHFLGNKFKKIIITSYSVLQTHFVLVRKDNLWNDFKKTTFTHFLCGIRSTVRHRFRLTSPKRQSGLRSSCAESFISKVGDAEWRTKGFKLKARIYVDASVWSQLWALCFDLRWP